MIHHCNVLEGIPLADQSVNCCVTSPPYLGLRDYGMPGQLGLEATPAAYVANMVQVFREVWRVLRDDGSLWLNLGDSYFGGGRGGNPEESAYRKQATNKGSLVPRSAFPFGCKPKDIIGIPWRVAFALQEDGWYLRSDIIWHKPNPMPESVTDRPTRSHEYIFLLTKRAKYHYDHEAIKEPGSLESKARQERADLLGKEGWADAYHGNPPKVLARKTGKQRGHSRRHTGFNDRWDAMPHADQCALPRNKRDVWTIATQPYSEAHFATFPEKLIEPCILAGCPEGGTVLDPFLGSGTTGAVAQRLGRNWVGCELNPEYIQLAQRRTEQGYFLSGTARGNNHGGLDTPEA